MNRHPRRRNEEAGLENLLSELGRRERTKGNAPRVDYGQFIAEMFGNGTAGPLMRHLIAECELGRDGHRSFGVSVPMKRRAELAAWRQRKAAA